MAFLVSYAGVNFQLDNDPRVTRWIERRIPVEDLCETNPVPDTPGRNLSAIGFPLWPKRPKLRIGEFFYPTGASRWSEFHALASTSTVRQMMAATFTHAGTGPVASTFILQADPYGTPNLIADSPPGVTTPMFMLPPRPLSVPGIKGSTSFDDLYLVTLVDERYYNFSVPGSLGPDGVITWTSIINTLAADMGITITVQNDSGYGVPHPDSPFWSDAENSSYQLDAAAWNIGCTVVRNYNGTYQLVPFGTINYPSLVQPWAIAGGQTDSGILVDSQGLLPALEAVLPSTIFVSFPKYLANYGYYANLGSFINSQPVRYIPWLNDQYPDIFAISINLSSATGQDRLGNNISSYGGTGKTMYFHDTARAYYTNWGDSTPANLTDLTNLATKIATDYWTFVANGIDQVYPGIRNWTPEGIHDLLFSWCYKKCTTRVMRKPWNFRLTEFSHDLADGSDGPNAGPAIELIRAATGTPDGSGRYDSFVRRWNGTTYSDTEEIWLRAPNGESITSGNQYIGRLMQFENGRKVYTVVVPGSGTGGVVVRVNTAGAANTLTAAFVETWADGTPPTHSDGTSCWALDINGLAVTAGLYDAVFLVTHSDGKAVYGVASGITTTYTLCDTGGVAHTLTFTRGALTAGT